MEFELSPCVSEIPMDQFNKIVDNAVGKKFLSRCTTGGKQVCGGNHPPDRCGFGVEASCVFGFLLYLRC